MREGGIGNDQRSDLNLGPCGQLSVYDMGAPANCPSTAEIYIFKHKIIAFPINI